MNKIKFDKNLIKKLISSAIIGLTNGFFGGGGGMVCVPLLENIYKIDNKKSHATTLAIIFPLSLVSSVIYIVENSINYLDLLYISLGVTVGGVLGAFLLKKLNNKVVRIIFAVVMFVAGLKMVI